MAEQKTIGISPRSCRLSPSRLPPTRGRAARSQGSGSLRASQGRVARSWVRDRVRYLCANRANRMSSVFVAFMPATPANREVVAKVSTLLTHVRQADQRNALHLDLDKCINFEPRGLTAQGPIRAGWRSTRRSWQETASSATSTARSRRAEPCPRRSGETHPKSAAAEATTPALPDDETNLIVHWVFDELSQADPSQPPQRTEKYWTDDARGQRRSRRNALRHGLTAETVIAAFEDAEDYEAFEATVIFDYDAESP